ncbi:MAG: iron complex outermembrane receptor protein, partial [Maribacter sp.]
MKMKNLMKTLFTVLIFTSSPVILAVETNENIVSLSEFLNEISSKHQVYFTYNPEIVRTTSLNTAEYNSPVLEEIINKLERKTSFDFKYLGNKYYVLFQKRARKVEISESKFLNSSLMGVTILDKLQSSVSGNVTDSDGLALAG